MPEKGTVFVGHHPFVFSLRNPEVLRSVQLLDGVTNVALRDCRAILRVELIELVDRCDIFTFLVSHEIQVCDSFRTPLS